MLDFFLFITSKEEFHVSDKSCPNCLHQGDKIIMKEIDSVIDGERFAADIAVCDECHDHMIIVEEPIPTIWTEGAYITYQM